MTPSHLNCLSFAPVQKIFAKKLTGHSLSAEEELILNGNFVDLVLDNKAMQDENRKGKENVPQQPTLDDNREAQTLDIADEIGGQRMTEMREAVRIYSMTGL